MISTDTDRTILRLGEDRSSQTAAPVHLYVAADAATASDANDGTDPAKPFATILAAIDHIPYLVRHLVVIHIASAATSYDIKSFGPHDLGKQIVFLADGAGQPDDDGFTELATGTAAAGTGDLVLVTTGLTIDEHQGKTIEFTSGAARGFRRTIRNHTATDIFPVEGFKAGPVSGDTFRIIKSSVNIRLPSLVLAVPNLILDNMFMLTGTGRAALGNSGDIQFTFGSRSYLAFVNLRFHGIENERCYFAIQNSSVAFFGCEAVGAAGSGDVDFKLDANTTLMAGQDFHAAGMRAQLCTDLGLATNVQAWGGWGLSFVDYVNAPGMDHARIRGTFVSPAGIGFRDCDLGLIGGFFGSDLGGASLSMSQNSRGRIGSYGGSGQKMLIRNDDTLWAVWVAGDSRMHMKNVVIEKDGGNSAIAVEGDGSGLNSNPAFLSLFTTIVITGANTPLDGITVTGGSQVSYDGGSLTITGCTNDLAVRENDLAETLIEASTVAALTDGDVLPAAITSDGRYGWIRALK